jgi:hypothetical protein
MTVAAEYRCALCQRVIPAENVEEQHCPGCNALICPMHPSDPWGQHEPDDHDVDTGEYEYA